jgi:hypothetical protein
MTLIWPRSPGPWAPGAHTIVLLDQAGWHLSATLTLPANISSMPLTAKSPEQARWTLLVDKIRRLVPPACVRDECGKLSLLDIAARGTFLGSQLVPLCPNCG